MVNGSPPQVITMWELYGCGMEQVAARVASRLNLPLHGQAFSSEQIEESMAQREREGSFGRFLRHLVPAAIPTSSAADAAIEEARTVEDTAREVSDDVNAFADEGGVILGRNGAFLLHDRPRSLHVKLVGRTAARVARAAQIFGISEDQSARRQPLEDDFRRELSQKIFRFDPTGDDYYDLVIDATRFDEDEVVELIVAAATARAR
ncbi:MAG TPA: cytidylate kinase family protein [Propionibacteriaceae bacterium]|nr:cytidylate kinase family protein [Propionibacteriaceae bacterium]